MIDSIEQVSILHIRLVVVVEYLCVAKMLLSIDPAGRAGKLRCHGNDKCAALL